MAEREETLGLTTQLDAATNLASAANVATEHAVESTSEHTVDLAANVAEKASTGVDGAANGTASTSTPTAEPKPVQSWRGSAGRAAIPAWQMAAAKKSEDAKKDTAESGTVEASPGS